MSRLASDTHPNLKLLNGDIIIFSSSPIPGNRLKIELLINSLVRRGAIIMENNVDGLLHTSGHAYKDELRKILKITKPDYFFPYHGEYQMLRSHAKIAKEAGVKGDNIFLLDVGRVVEILKGEARITDKLPLGVDYIDGNTLHKGNKTIFFERAQMGRNGVVLITLIISAKRKEVVGIPRFYLYGVVDSIETAYVYSNVRRLINKSCEIILNQSRAWNKNDIRVVLEKQIAEFFHKTLKRKPSLVLNIFLIETMRRDMLRQLHESKIEPKQIIVK